MSVWTSVLMTGLPPGADDVYETISMARNLYEESEQLLARLQVSRWHVNHFFAGVYLPTCCDVCSVAVRLLELQHRIYRGAGDLVRDLVCQSGDVGQQDQAIRLYAYVVFRAGLPQGLLREQAQVASLAESSLAIVLNKDPAIHRLTASFIDEYEALVRAFATWRGLHPEAHARAFQSPGKQEE